MGELTGVERQRYERAMRLLHLFGIERTGWRRYVFGRWRYNEPYRNDAAWLAMEAGSFDAPEPHTQNCLRPLGFPSPDSAKEGEDG